MLAWLNLGSLLQPRQHLLSVAGILECPIDVISDETILVSLWKHENTRVFADKLARTSTWLQHDMIISYED